MMEEQDHPQYSDVDYRTLDPKKQAKDAPRVWHTDKNVEDVLLDKKGDAQPARHPQDAGVMELDTKQ